MMGREKEHSLSGFPELQIHKTALFSPLLFPKQTLLLSEKKNRITISKWRIRPPTEKPWYLPGFLVVASFPLAGPINYFFKFSSQIEVADDTRQVESKMSFKLQHNF